MRGQRGIAEQVFFGAAASVGERAHLPRVKLLALGRQLAGHHMGQRQVHVVAAQQNMFAHGDAVQFQLAALLQHRNQRKVAGAAAHVDDQDDVAGLDLFAPAPAAALNPVVKRGLRLFKQCQRGVAGSAGGLGGQFARGRVKRGRNRDGDVLLLKRRVGVGLVPGLAQVGQVAGRGF